MIPLPLKQGLKLIIQHFNLAGRLRYDSTSTKTRIETRFTKKGQKALEKVMIPLPLKQGLKLLEREDKE